MSLRPGDINLASSGDIKETVRPHGCGSAATKWVSPPRPVGVHPTDDRGGRGIRSREGRRGRRTQAGHRHWRQARVRRRCATRRRRHAPLRRNTSVAHRFRSAVLGDVDDLLGGQHHVDRVDDGSEPQDGVVADDLLPTVLGVEGDAVRCRGPSTRSPAAPSAARDVHR